MPPTFSMQLVKKVGEGEKEKGKGGERGGRGRNGRRM